MMEPSVDRRRLAYVAWTRRLLCAMLCMYLLGGWSEAQLQLAAPLGASNEGLRTTTNGWMEIADNPSIALAVFTAEVWVKAWSGGLIVTRDISTGSPSDWQLWYEFSRRRLAFITAQTPPDSYFFTDDGSVLPDRWYHIALVVNGVDGSAKLYLDGRLVLSPTFSPRDFSAHTGLAWGGYFNNSSGAYLDAVMDEARYWNVERSEEQIRSAMNAALRSDDRQGLRGYWRFCGNYADSSGYGNHGVRRGTADLTPIVDLPHSFDCLPAPCDTLHVRITPSDSGFCAGGSVRLQATHGFASYSWSTGDTTETIVVSQPGTYNVRVSDGLGCTGTSPLCTIQVWPSPPKPRIYRDGDSLRTDPATWWQWYFNGAALPDGNRQAILYRGPGVYNVHVENVHGCITVSNPWLSNVDSGKTVVYIPHMHGSAGWPLRVPILLESQEGLENAVDLAFRARVHFDQGLLAPADAVLRRDSCGGFVADLEGSYTYGDDELTSFRTLVTLGVRRHLPIYLLSFEWLEGNIDVETRDGSVTLTLCEEGGVRMVDDSQRLRLAPNHPNPFNSSTLIVYETLEQSPIQLHVLDMLGRRVQVLYDGMQTPGRHSVTFDARNLPSGQYILRLQAGYYVLQQPMLLLK